MRKGIIAISLEPNTYIKLSELGFKGEEWNFNENAMIVLELINLFSPRRCMFASNFPVSKIKILFNNLFDNYKKIVENLSTDEKKCLFAENAIEDYNLNKSFLNKRKL